MIISWLDDVLSQIEKEKEKGKFYVLWCDWDLINCEAVTEILFCILIFFSKYTA